MQKQQNIDLNKIPVYVTPSYARGYGAAMHVTSTLKNAGFEAFLVGGCVRDLILGREPKDWDVTTNATPDQIIGLFEKTVYENTFGTVAVCIPQEESVTPSSAQGYGEASETSDNVTHETNTKTYYDIIEVTPYRLESTYSDNRHPDSVTFSQNIQDDLKRRDFTINSMAMDSKGQIIDPYKGQDDIKDKTIRAVGEPEDRFKEDALRMLRAVRFASQLEFAISSETMGAIVDNSTLIKNVSFERIRDEFTKIIDSKNPASGVDMLQKFGLLKYIIPELEQGIQCHQGGAHKYDVYTHLIMALQHASDKGYSIEIRLAALFHDIGKPKSKREGTKNTKPTSAQGYGAVKPTFYGHEVIGARMAKIILERLKYPKNTIELVVKLVRYHMFFSDTEQITLSAVRRMVQNVGKEHIWELMNIRECDRVGMAKTEAPYRLRKYHAMIEEVLHDPISVSALKINGQILINELHMKPSRRMGFILHALLEEVLDDPNKNDIEYLKDRALELDKMSDIELQKIGESAKEKKDDLEDQEVKKLHMKHGV